MDGKEGGGGEGGGKGGGGRRRVHKTVGSFVAGSAAGMTSTIGLQPLEVIKTHMQARDSSRGSGGHGHGIRGAVKLVVEKDGMRGFWRGTGPACVRAGLGGGLYFAMLGPVLTTLQRYSPSSSSSVIGNAAAAAAAVDPVQRKLSASVTASAGALTRLLAATITCPVTVIKTRMEYAAASGLRYKGTVSAFLHIKRTEGLSGLYSGMWPTLVRDAPYSGLYLVIYTRIRHLLKEAASSSSSSNSAHVTSSSSSSSSSSQIQINFLAGAVSGSIATFLTHPPDVLRTRMQLDKGGHMGMISTLRQIVQLNGLKGLFVGALPRLGRRGLQQAFSWTVFEELSRRMDQAQ